MATPKRSATRRATPQTGPEIILVEAVRADLLAADRRLDDATRRKHDIVSMDHVRASYTNCWVLLLRTAIDEHYQTTAGRVILTAERGEEDAFDRAVEEFVATHEGCRPSLVFIDDHAPAPSPGTR